MKPEEYLGSRARDLRVAQVIAFLDAYGCSQRDGGRDVGGASYAGGGVRGRDPCAQVLPLDGSYRLSIAGYAPRKPAAGVRWTLAPRAIARKKVST